MNPGYPRGAWSTLLEHGGHGEKTEVCFSQFLLSTRPHSHIVANANHERPGLSSRFHFSPCPKRVLRRPNREFHHEGTKTRRRAKEDEEEALTSSNAGRIADDYGTTTKDIEGNSFSLLPAFFVSSCLRGDIFAVHVGYLCSKRVLHAPRGYPWFKGSLDIARQKKGVIHG